MTTNGLMIIELFIWVCMEYMHAHAGAGAYIHMLQWMPGVRIGRAPPYSPETVALAELQLAVLVRLAGDKPPTMILLPRCPTVLGLQTFLATWTMLCAGDLNSGPHAV